MSEDLGTAVRANDYDRWLSALFAPAAARPHLFALYAFNFEVAKIAEAVGERMMGEIRRQWWREAIEGIYAGAPPRHAVAQALAGAIRERDLPRVLFDELIDARAFDLSDETFPDIAALEAYADATSGHVMRLAVRILGVGDACDTHAREAGIAYALTGLLRAAPFHAARRKLFLPRSALDAAGADPEDIFAGRANAALRAAMAVVASAARARLAMLERLPKPEALPALLPAALCRAHLARTEAEKFDPFVHRAEISPLRRPFAMLWAALRGRV